MSSLTLDNSLMQPYHNGELFQIAHGNSGPALRVVKDAKEQTLPEVLKQLPNAIAMMASHSIEERFHFYDRLAPLSVEVVKYNEEIDNDLCTTILHVILLILTFGGFYYRDSCKLEDPKVSLTSLFPSSLDWDKFKTEYKADRFRALPEKHRRELSSLLKLENAQVDHVLKGKFPQGATLAGALTLPNKQPKRLVALLSANPPSETDIRSLVQELSAANLVKELGLEGLTEEEVFSGTKQLTISPGCNSWIRLLTKEQWTGLPKAVFFLLISHASPEVLESFPREQPFQQFSLPDFQRLYATHDPELQCVFQFKEGNIRLLRTLIRHSFGEGYTDAGARHEIPSPIDISTFSTASVDSLISKTTEILHLISAEQIPGLSLQSLFTFYGYYGENLKQPVKLAIKTEVAKFTAADVTAYLKCEKLTEEQALSVTYLHRTLHAIIPLITEKQWQEVSLPVFLLLILSNWKETSSDNSNSIVPVEVQIGDATFRKLYLERDPTCLRLPSLALGETEGGTTLLTGGGVILLERLMPLPLESLKPLLSKLAQDSQRIREGKREDLRGPEVHPFTDISSLISRTLSADEIAQLEKPHFETLVELWTFATRPKVTDPNFAAWIARLSAEKRSNELYLITRPGRETNEKWTSFLESSSPASLWSFLTAIPYSGPKIDMSTYSRSTTSDRVVETQFQDPTSHIQVLCRLIPEGKWAEMMQSKEVKQLAWFFQKDRLLMKEPRDIAKISSALAALAKQKLPEDLELLSSLISGAPHYLPQKGEQPPYKGAIDQLVARASEQYCASFAEFLADKDQALLFEHDLNTLPKHLFVPILEANTEAFIARTLDASLAIQKKVLWEFVSYPIAQGSASEALVAALEKDDAELVKLWKEIKETAARSSERTTASRIFQDY